MPKTNYAKNPDLLCTHITRYRQLIRVLGNLPEHEATKHFDMQTWGRDTECGTVACAAGHAGLDAWFVEQGFHLWRGMGGIYVPAYKNYSNWGAIEAFFGGVYEHRRSHDVFSHPRDITGVIEAAHGRIHLLHAIAVAIDYATALAV